MSDKEFVIEMEDDTEGHGVRRAIVEPEEAEWLEERLRRDSGKTNFRITLRDEDEEDTEGHDGGATLRLNLVDDDDTEGHAIAIHFPSRADADAFRRRLLVTGVLVGTVALGAAGGVGLSALQSDDRAPARPVRPSHRHTPTPRRQRPTRARVRVERPWPMLRHTPTTRRQRPTRARVRVERHRPRADRWTSHEARAAAMADAQAYANYQEAAANEGARQGGGTQVGPMDVNEARALQAAGASSVDADSDIGIMDASGAAAGTNTGPMDVNEARALQAAGASTVDPDSDIGIMDASGAAAGTSTGAPTYVDAARHQALQNQAAADDDASPDPHNIGGPAPR